MAPPVWKLSVDVEAKTGAFKDGMADAAKSARESFGGMKDGAKEAGDAVGQSMSGASQNTALLGEAFREMTSGIVSEASGLSAVAPMMEAAFPFLAIAAGAVLLIQHLRQLKEEAEQLAAAQNKFEIATDSAFNALDDKILQAEIQADRLNKDYLHAVQKELELIDHQSMQELVHELETVAKAADEVFKAIHTHWYESGSGAVGAQDALSKFKSQYDLLLAQGKDKDASDLLKGTRESAQSTIELMKQVRDNQPLPVTADRQSTILTAQNELRARSAGWSQDELRAQEALVQALNAQFTIEGKITQLKTLEGSNAENEKHKGPHGHANHDADRLMRSQGQSFKTGLEIEQREWEEHYRSALNALEQSEREKIAATQQGSQERLAAISEAIKKEEGYGLQETGFYRSLLTQRVELVRQMSAEEAKQREQAGREAAEHGQKMAELQIAADRQAAELRRSARHTTEQEALNDEVNFANREYQIKADALRREADSLDKFGKDYQNKLKAIQDKELQLTKAHENQLTQIKEKAEIERNNRILSAEHSFEDSIARGLASMITGHQTFGQMMLSIGDQIATGMIENAIKAILADDMTKPHDAAAAARKAFLAGMHFPFPVNLVMAPVLGAAAFASVMAFEDGGVVPGVGRGDTVPAMLTPGEGVVPGGTMEKLNSMARSGKLEGGSGETHYHAHFAPHVQVIDATGVDKMLSKHGDKFHRHFENHLRKQNR